VPPPGANGTMSRIGRTGYSWAPASDPDTPINTVSMNRDKRGCIMASFGFVEKLPLDPIGA
jgi:hypothetical protein